ncbi:hypothetical protein HGA89_04080 [bacterium]|nr:hypothetical protein [bacterium]
MKWAPSSLSWTIRCLSKQRFTTRTGTTFKPDRCRLAATSNRHALRRLGGRRWQALHRAIYPIAILAVIHYWWLVKRDVATPALYAVAVLALLGLRALWRDRERREQLAGKYAPQQPPRVRGRIIPIVSQRK